MSSKTQKLFRINLLLQARSASRMGLTINEYAVGTRAHGFTDASPEIVRGR